MVMKKMRLPLGVDIGATRIRVLEVTVTPDGPRVRAVAVREISSEVSSSGAISDTDYVAALLEEAVREIGTRERRCICALGEPDASLRDVTFPKMTAVERQRTARFEAQRYVDFPIDEAIVRIHPIAGSSQWTLGIARSFAIATRLATLKKAGLKPVAVDHEACALVRALPGYDAIADIGHQRTSLHITTGTTPITFQTFNGGADVTRAIQRELSIDEHTAEKRKRILGTAGAGERARATLAADIALLVANARKTMSIGRVALVGNGARLPGLAAHLEAATNALFELPVTDALRPGAYPEDVVRSSAPDWTLAAGLTSWKPA
jgi:Tfp pilus assembly PilM family ATPase